MESKIKQIKSKLLNAAGKYADYHSYLDTLYDLDEKYDEVAVIGDAVAPRKILTAIHEGYHAIRVME